MACLAPRVWYGVRMGNFQGPPCCLLVLVYAYLPSYKPFLTAHRSACLFHSKFWWLSSSLLSPPPPCLPHSPHAQPLISSCLHVCKESPQVGPAVLCIVSVPGRVPPISFPACSTHPPISFPACSTYPLPVFAIKAGSPLLSLLHLPPAVSASFGSQAGQH